MPVWREPPARQEHMNRDAAKVRNALQNPEAHVQNGNAVLEALVRSLARMAAAQDYEAHGGMPPAAAPEEGS